MRVELRLEENEHEWAVTIEADGSVTADRAIDVAQTALLDVRSPVTEFHVQKATTAAVSKAMTAAASKVTGR